MKYLITLLLSLVILVPSYGATVYVTKSGNDSNDGSTVALAKLTVASGITVANIGDTILVGPGTYAENGLTLPEGITLIGEGSTTTKISDSTSPILTLGDACTLKNIEIESSATSYCLEVSTSAQNVLIDGCNLDGSDYGLSAANTVGICLKDTVISGKIVAALLSDCVGGEIINTYFASTNSSGTTVDSKCVSMVSDESLEQETQTALFRNCNFVNVRSDVTGASDRTIGFEGNGLIRFENCRFRITQSSESALGNSYGIIDYDGTDDNGALVALVDNCNIMSSTSGTGSSYVANKINSASIINVINQGYFTGLTTGYTAVDTTNISAEYVPKGRTWKFSASDQITATPKIKEINGFEGLIQMDFSNNIGVSTDSSISSATVDSISPSSGLTSGTVSLSADKKSIKLDLTASSANTYTVTVRVTTADSQVFYRKGVIEIE